MKSALHGLVRKGHCLCLCHNSEFHGWASLGHWLYLSWQMVVVLTQIFSSQGNELQTIVISLWEMNKYMRMSFYIPLALHKQAHHPVVPLASYFWSRPFSPLDWVLQLTKKLDETEYKYLKNKHMATTYVGESVIFSWYSSIFCAAAGSAGVKRAYFCHP